MIERERVVCVFESNFFERADRSGPRSTRYVSMSQQWIDAASAWRQSAPVQLVAAFDALGDTIRERQAQAGEPPSDAPPAVFYFAAALAALAPEAVAHQAALLTRAMLDVLALVSLQCGDADVVSSLCGVRRVCTASRTKVWRISLDTAQLALCRSFVHWLCVRV